MFLMSEATNLKKHARLGKPFRLERADDLVRQQADHHVPVGRPEHVLRQPPHFRPRCFQPEPPLHLFVRERERQQVTSPSRYTRPHSGR